MPTQAQQSKSSPRHEEVTQSLLEAIADKRYVVGALLPTENELADIYNVSRQTVRTALLALQNRGYISRKKGVGSKVESLSPDSNYSQTLNSLDDLVRVAATEIRLMQSATELELDRDEARSLEAPLNSAWICITGMRVDSRRPERSIASTRILIDARFSRIVDSVMAQPEILVSELLEQQCGQVIDEVRQNVTAIALTEDQAKQFNLPAGTPALRVLRHYMTAQAKIVEITETIYPSDRMKLVSRLLRRRPGEKI